MKLPKLTEQAKLGLGSAALVTLAYAISAFASTPISRAKKELKKWKGLNETDPQAKPLLASYWASVNLPPQPASTPWSAAFISTVAPVKPSSNHIGYTRSAWNARLTGRKGEYWAYEPTEVLPIKKGDIIVRGRGQPVGWSDVTHDTGHKDSHGDIVTNVSKSGVLTLIGGNVSDAVTQKEYTSLPPHAFAVLRKA